LQCYKGEALSLYISDQDGISIPASNIMDSIDEALNLPKRIPRLEYRQYPRRGRGYNNNYNRGGGPTQVVLVLRYIYKPIIKVKPVQTIKESNYANKTKTNQKIMF
jgi:hypothetical protein